MLHTAICRGCRKKLIGKPYHLGGGAYDPVTLKSCKVNHYGGYVCSPECDYRVSLDMLSSMPGAGTATSLDCYARESYNRNWKG
jgi:hypothetical protein